MADYDHNIVVDDVDTDIRNAIAEAAGETIDAPAEPLKVEPAAEADAPKDVPINAEGRARDEHGRFMKRTEPTADKPDEPAEAEKSAQKLEPVKDQQQQQQQEQKPADAPRPPISWSIPAKAAWEKLPADVQQAVAKREAEMNNGLAELADYKDLKPYRDWARQNGQTLGQAFGFYAGIDNMMRQDAGRGMAHIAQNLGLTQSQAAELFATLARQLGGGAHLADQNGHPVANQNGADPALFQHLAPIVNPMVQPLAQRLQQLENQFTQQSQQEKSLRDRQANDVIEKFRSDPANRYYDNLEIDVERILKAGLIERTGDMLTDLKAAYDMACWQHPEVRETFIKERFARAEEERRAKDKEAVEKAKAASRSITGSPAPGATQQTQRRTDTDDIEADIRAAMREV